MRELLGLQKAQGGTRAGNQKTSALETLVAADAVSRLQPVEAQPWESATEAAA
jgi:hypothetical protein